LKLLLKILTHKRLSLDAAMREATLEISKYKRRLIFRIEAARVYHHRI
jgi:hypothetical protein